MKKQSKVVRMKQVEEKPPPETIPAKTDQEGMAAYMEQKGELDKAIGLYEKLMKRQPNIEHNYNRLMIIYRKKKDTKNELRVLNTGIKTFEELYTPVAASTHRNIVKLSKQLNILTGLTDKRGKSLHDPEPIGRWKKRKALLLARSKKTGR